jgi:hypothetical protein
MKKWMLVAIMVLLPVSAWAIEVNTVGVVTNGTITATGSYRAFSGPTNPAFENQADYRFYGRGQNVGFADQGAYAGAIGSQQQIQVGPNGFGTFESKVGTGILTTVQNEEGETIGTLVQNAIGFGGNISEGLITVGFNTAATGGFTGLAEVQGQGTFQAGAVGYVTTGSAIATVIEKKEFRWVFGPGQFQAKMSIIFPK